MTKQVSKYSILLLLAIMFAAPGISAYIFFKHPDWLGSTTVNKGTLLKQPELLPQLGSNAKWRIILWSPADCDVACLKQLDVLAKIRLALGRKLYYVDQWLVLGDDAASLSQETTDLLKTQDFNITQLSSQEQEKVTVFSGQPRVFLVNPDNYLILSYDAQVNPDDVYKDLKLLLNTGNKNG